MYLNLNYYNKNSSKLYRVDHGSGVADTAEAICRCGNLCDLKPLAKNTVSQELSKTIIKII